MYRLLIANVQVYHSILPADFIMCVIYVLFICWCIKVSRVVCCSVRSVMHKHLEKMGEVNFDKIFNQKLGKFTNILNIYVSPAVECVLF